MARRDRSKWWEDVLIGLAGSYLGSGSGAQSAAFGASAAGLASLIRGKKDPFRSAAIGAAGGVGGRAAFSGLAEAHPDNTFWKALDKTSFPMFPSSSAYPGGAPKDGWTAAQKFQLALAREGRAGGGQKSWISQWGPTAALAGGGLWNNPKRSGKRQR